MIKWTLEAICESAKPFATKNDWRKAYREAYAAAHWHKVVDLATAHMIKTKSPTRVCKDCASTKDYPREFRKNSYECRVCMQRRTRAWREKNSYMKHKKSHCERCPFVATHPCQLDVDHVDGDHSNNNVENLQTLCANCHRLKTRECWDYNNKNSRAS